MYDALGVYLDSAAEDQGRKILVLFTDGGDTRSTIRFGDVLTLVRASDVTVYSVGFLENQPSSARSEQRLRLTHCYRSVASFFPYRLAIEERRQESRRFALSRLRLLATHTTPMHWRKVEIKGGVRRQGSRVQSRKGYLRALPEVRLSTAESLERKAGTRLLCCLLYYQFKLAAIRLRGAVTRTRSSRTEPRRSRQSCGGHRIRRPTLGQVLARVNRPTLVWRTTRRWPRSSIRNSSASLSR